MATTSAVRTRAECRELLALRIEQSKLSAGTFARQVLKRDPRTIRKWLDGSQHIPREPMDFLVSPEPAPWPTDDGGNR